LQDARDIYIIYYIIILYILLLYIIIFKGSHNGIP